MSQKKILIVEDEFLTGADIRSKLLRMGYHVTDVVDSGEAAIEAVQIGKPDLILMDITLSGRMTGIEAAEMIQTFNDIPVIYLTAHTDQSTVSRAKSSAPSGYLVKPFDERTLQITVDVALHKHEMDLKLKASEERYRSIAELSEDYILILDRSHTLRYINRVGAILLGEDQDAMIGKRVEELVSDAIYDKIVRAVDDVFYTGQKHRIQDKFPFPPDDEVWVDITLIPLITNGEDDQVMMVARDITVEKIIERDLQDQGLAQIEKNMEQFQILNDQIRNPLQTITLMVSLEEGPYTEKILEHIGVIDDLIKQIDRGWLESSKVRSFLMKYYRHGEYAMKKGTCSMDEDGGYQ